jgi:hypothetical protein
MKKTIIIVVAGLLVGILGGSFVRGTKERDVILAQMAAEKATADSLASIEGVDDSHEADASGQGESQIDDALDEGVLVADSGVEDDPGHTPTPSEEPVKREGAPAENEIDPSVEEYSAPAESVEDGQTASPSFSEPAENPVPPPIDPTELINEGPARLAKIFGAMEPKDAAAVLENLSDIEVESILLTMSDRKVAGILGEFAPERAASLSRVVMAPRSGIDR